MLKQYNWLKLRVNLNYASSFKLTRKNLNYAPHLRIKTYVRIFNVYFTFFFFNIFFFFFLHFSFKIRIQWPVSRTGISLILITWQSRCREIEMNGSKHQWMHSILPPSLRLGTTTSLTDSLVPCQINGMRRPAASICPLRRCPSH